MRAPWLLVFASLLLPAVGHGFVVNTTSDGTDAAPGNGVCATSGATCSLRAAIQESNALAGTQTITLGAGVHTLTIMGRGENAAATGDLDVTSDLVIEGAGAGVTVIDGLAVDRILEQRGSGVDLTLSDLTIRNGEVLDEEGAGLRSGSDGLLTLTRVSFEDNEVLGVSSAALGGAVSSDEGGTLLVYESVFVGNAAFRGGAIFGNGSTVLVDSTLEGNVALRGSAILAFGPTTVERSAFLGNQATVNGTLEVLDSAGVVRNTTFSGNEDPSALLATNEALELVNLTIFDNAADTALYVFTPGVAELVNSVIVNPLAVTECGAASGAEIQSLGNNLDGDGSCTSEPSDQTSSDPGLGPLADNGGPTLTHQPLPGSPLIDTGSNVNCPTVDQRAISRPRDGNDDSVATCDIGSVEVPEPGAFSNSLAMSAALVSIARARLSRRGRADAGRKTGARV